MNRRSFLIGLFAGSAVTAGVALVARRADAPSRPAPDPGPRVSASPADPRPAEANAPEVPPGSVKQYFNGTPFYVVPLQPLAVR